MHIIRFSERLRIDSETPSKRLHNRNTHNSVLLFSNCIDDIIWRQKIMNSIYFEIIRNSTNFSLFFFLFSKKKLFFCFYSLTKASFILANQSFSTPPPPLRFLHFIGGVGIIDYIQFIAQQIFSFNLDKSNQCRKYTHTQGHTHTPTHIIQFVNIQQSPHIRCGGIIRKIFLVQFPHRFRAVPSNILFHAKFWCLFNYLWFVWLNNGDTYT